MMLKKNSNWGEALGHFMPFSNFNFLFVIVHSFCRLPKKLCRLLMIIS